MAWIKTNSLSRRAVADVPGCVRVVWHESVGIRFELAFGAPQSELRPYVSEYIGWLDESTVRARRRQVPSGVVPLIMNLESAVREQKADEIDVHTYRAFTAGLHERYTIVEPVGGGLGFQVNFTPLGARLYYDRPLAEFTNLTVELSDVIGTSAGTLMSQLHDTTSWHERFQVLEGDIRARLGRARRPPDAIAQALHALRVAHGDLRIRRLAEVSAWGERHLTSQFREHVGLTPKGYARLLRLGRAMSLGRDARARPLVAIAQTCGYYDQAHLARECRAISGLSPSALLQHQLPADSGFSA
ncbi:MAG TPA: helix-turn-helix transcriptional regulator [Vicinamibacterales bacterium]|jgi:AraC-like DNA-binding protein|nr:helix-turn-helix transcriptional regulator [Vicinamibacterales bacterium]